MSGVVMHSVAAAAGRRAEDDDDVAGLLEAVEEEDEEGADDDGEQVGILFYFSLLYDFTRNLSLAVGARPFRRIPQHGAVLLLLLRPRRRQGEPLRRRAEALREGPLHRGQVHRDHRTAVQHTDALLRLLWTGEFGADFPLPFVGILLAVNFAGIHQGSSGPEQDPQSGALSSPDSRIRGVPQRFLDR